MLGSVFTFSDESNVEALSIELIGYLSDVFQGIKNVEIYLDLLFDMSLVFIFAYFSANLFLEDNYIFPAEFIVICTVMYGIIWSIRSAAL